MGSILLNSNKIISYSEEDIIFYQMMEILILVGMDMKM